MTDRSTIHAILVAARKRIEDPANWCQEWHFILKDGTPTLFSDLVEDPESLWPTPESKAIAFAKVERCCLDGAVLLQTGSDSSQAYIDVQDILKAEAKRLYDITNHVEVNDGEDGHARVMKLLDVSIAWAAAE